jgi:hypothetical protein
MNQQTKREIDLALWQAANKKPRTLPFVSTVAAPSGRRRGKNHMDASKTLVPDEATPLTRST